ncbi:MAG: hypothetical protein DLD55_05485 [candidate division SR1 bacterium]|nr:MAG: hypothetical protein DLD55_05485 [candidate division SR1 bacterium]
MRFPFFLLVCGVFFSLAGCNQLAELENNSDYQEAKQVTLSGFATVSEKTTEFVQKNEYAQQAMDTATQVLDQAKEQAGHVVEQVKTEVQNQYDQLKTDAKNQIKSGVNQKIDQAFEGI